MSEALKAHLVWAGVVIVVAVILGTAVTETNRQNRDLENQMRLGGYEQGSVPGQTGVYWIKVRQEWQ
jgi:hypothetical protein